MYKIFAICTGLQLTYEAADGCWCTDGCVVGGEVSGCQGPYKPRDDVYDGHAQRRKSQRPSYVQPKCPQGDDCQRQLDCTCSAANHKIVSLVRTLLRALGPGMTSFCHKLHCCIHFQKKHPVSSRANSEQLMYYLSATGMHD